MTPETAQTPNKPVVRPAKVAENSKPRCVKTNRSGQPCRATPKADGYCWFHSPNVPEEEKRLAVLRGGYVSRQLLTRSATSSDPALRTPEDLTAFLERTAGQLLRGEIRPGEASSLAKIASVAANTFHLDIGRQLEELRKIAKEQQAKMTGRLTIHAT